MRNYVLLTPCLIALMVPAKALSQRGGPGKAIKLDGSNYLAVTNSLGKIDFPITLEAWVMLDDTKMSRFPIFVSHQGTSFGYHGIWTLLDPNTNQVIMGYGDGRGSNDLLYRREAVASLDMEANRWMHFAFVFASPRDMRIYLDGIQLPTTNVGSGNLDMALDKGATPTIGYMEFDGADYLAQGQIDEVRLWSTARTESEIRTHLCQHVNTSYAGLIGYWEMDGAFNDRISDISPKDNSANMINSPTLVASGAPIGEISAYYYSANGALTSIEDSWKSPEFDFILGLERVLGYHVYVINTEEVTNDCSAGPVQGYFIPWAMRGDTTFQMTYKSDQELVVRYSNASGWEEQKSIVAHESITMNLARWESQSMADFIPVVSLPGDFNVCGNPSVILQPTLGESGLSLEWSTGSTDPSIEVTEGGDYWVIASNACGSDTAFTAISFTPLPMINIYPELVDDCLFPFYRLRSISNNPDINVTWSTGQKVRDIEVQTSGLYAIEATDECGTVSAEIEITIPEPELDRMPNIFTPNDDGVNDGLEILEKLEGARVKIFNRWGELVVELEDYKNGTWEGDQVPDGVYFLSLQDPCSMASFRYPIYIMR